MTGADRAQTRKWRECMLLAEGDAVVCTELKHPQECCYATEHGSVISDRGQFVFTPEMNRTIVSLEADRNHLKKWVLAQFVPDQGSLECI
ncbi:hypothetical protein AMECASPLE_031165 [Ameca splendens]|uniref:Uncharacterized protein n=1 Tax=Ameca splendens TaxID=208324 RepID=A0ABV0ZGU6_9TELE